MKCILKSEKPVWAITDLAFRLFLNLEQSGINQLQSNNITFLECSSRSMAIYNRLLRNKEPQLLTSGLGTLLIYLYENNILNNENLILKSKTIPTIYAAMDKTHPDNHAIIVGSMNEYVQARKYYGLEDIYFWRK